MNVPLKEKKAEAIERLNRMGVFKQYIDDFRRSGRIQVSEPPLGALYWLDEKEDKVLIDYIKEFENDGERLVYLVVRCWFEEIWKVDNLFYVSDFKEDWKYDHEDMKENRQIVNCYNYGSPWCSESGSIGYETTYAGGVRRIW